MEGTPSLSFFVIRYFRYRGSAVHHRVLYQCGDICVEQEKDGLRLSAEAPRSFVLLEYQNFEGEI